ncbi:hypothetical protein [Nocardioides alcanivorans]|uniref:hypothetical protein n=1 Tax=Nocardioides alcanivorans TaxID=2897352 RepID=UPI001F294A66|nr:hypothetical protein [Nocardioides alcanivorans]
MAIAVGLVAREQREEKPLGAVRTGGQLGERVVVAAPITLALLLVGGASAALLSHQFAPAEHTTEVHVALTLPPDPYSVPAVTTLVNESQLTRRELRVTLDTEAALLLSDQTLQHAGTHPTGISLTAPPHTQILLVTVQAPGAEESREQALSVVHAYLEARQAYVAERRTDLLTRLREDLREVLPATRPVRS